MTRSMGDDEGRVQVTRKPYGEIEGIVNEACRQFILNGHEVPDDFEDEEYVDWDGIRRIVTAFTRTPLGKLQFFTELELCVIHECDLEICEDDNAPECQQIRDYLSGRTQ